MIRSDNPIEKVKEAKQKLSNIQDISMKDINRESYEYKLAYYYYWLYKNEQHDHSITKQELVASEGAVEEYANAFHGQDRQGMTAQKIADQMVNGILAACTDIDDIAKTSKLSQFFKITWPFVFLVLGGIFLWQFMANAEVRQALLSNIGGLILLAAIGVIGYYLWSNRK